jgi:hypothetical protein
MELVLWLLHPRKGAGRVVTVKLIKEEEVGEAVKFLQKAHKQAKKDIWRNVLAWPKYPKPPEEEA